MMSVADFVSFMFDVIVVHDVVILAALVMVIIDFLLTVWLRFFKG